MIPANQRARRSICFPFPRCYQSKIGVGRRGLIKDDFNGEPVLKCPSKDSAALKEKIIIYPMIASMDEFALQILFPVLKDGATLCNGFSDRILVVLVQSLDLEGGDFTRLCYGMASINSTE